MNLKGCGHQSPRAPPRPPGQASGSPEAPEKDQPPQEGTRGRGAGDHKGPGDRGPPPGLAVPKPRGVLRPLLGLWLSVRADARPENP